MTPIFNRCLSQFIAGISISCLSLSLVSAQTTDVVTAPVGFINTTIQPGTGASIGAPLLKAAVDAGAVTAVGTSTITRLNAGWTAGAFTTAAAPHIIKMMTGTAAGRFFFISSNTADTLTVDNGGTNLSTIIKAATPTEDGDKYQIIPLWTLKTLFADVALTKNGSASLADNVYLRVGANWVTYWHNGTSWVGGGLGSKDNTILYPDEAILFQRRGATALTIAIAGTATTTKEMTEIPGPGSTYMSLRFPTDTTLGGLALQTLPGWIKNGSASVADNVYLRTPTAWVTYWHNGTSWVGGGLGSKDTTPVPAGSALLVIRKSTATGADAFLSQNAPY
jgi:uncharacterized protein (TIGR02597 family)